MLETSVYSLGDPGTFDLIAGDPMYWTERLSFELSKNLYNLSNGGYKFRQPVAADYTTLETTVNTYITSFATWADSAVDASNDGLPIPVPPTLPTLPDFLSGEVWAMLIKLGLGILIRWIEKKLESGTEASEIAQVLKQGLIGLAGGEEYSFIELLQNTPLEIRVSSKNEYEDITFTSD